MNQYKEFPLLLLLAIFMLSIAIELLNAMFIQPFRMIGKWLSKNWNDSAIHTSPEEWPVDQKDEHRKYIMQRIDKVRGERNISFCKNLIEEYSNLYGSKDIVIMHDVTAMINALERKIESIQSYTKPVKALVV